MYSDEERREREGSKSQQSGHITNKQPSIRPSTRTCSQRKNGKKKLYLLEIPPILEKNMTYETTGQDRNLPCHPPRCGSENP